MPSRYDKTHAFTVPADQEQAVRWQDAAALEGPSVESWLSDAADTRIKELARSGRQPPLPWFKDSFVVLLSDGERRVCGIVSGFFGVFRGGWHGLGEPGSGRHSLVHLPCRRIIDTLPLRKSCMALAAELAALRIPWQEEDPDKVLAGAPDQEKARQLIRLFDKLTYPTS